MSKRKRKPNNKVNTKTPSEFVEVVAGAPRREGFDIGKWRMAIRSAENPTDPNRILLYDIYNDILLDTHLTAVLEKREDAIAGSNITFSGTSENKAISELINMPWFEDMLKDSLNAKFWGYSAMWLDIAGGVFNKYRLLKRKHIRPEKSLFLNKPEDKEGINFLNPPYSYYVLHAGKTDDLGVLLKAVPWVLLKRGDVSDWATFNELFAAPFRKGTYQMGTPGKDELIKALKTSGSMSWAAIPNDTSLEFIQNTASGSTTAYKTFAEFCDKQISKLFLGNTLTTDAEGGKYKGDIHRDSEKSKFAADRRFILNLLNTYFIELLEVHGFKPNGSKFSFVKDDNMPLDKRLDMDMKLSEKIEIPTEYWYSKYDIPMPKGGAKVAVKSKEEKKKKLSAPRTDAQLHVSKEQNPKTKKKHFWDFFV